MHIKVLVYHGIKKNLISVYISQYIFYLYLFIIFSNYSTSGCYSEFHATLQKAIFRQLKIPLIVCLRRATILKDYYTNNECL